MGGRSLKERVERSSLLPFVEGSSTTNIIETILERYEKRS